MSLQDRIQLLNKDHFTDSDQQIVIDERAHDGQASILLKVSRRCLALHKADARRIVFLKNQSVADHIVLELQHEQAVAMHIFELKTSIGLSEWERIQMQFDGAFNNALGLLGILGLEMPQKIYFYAAFSKDKLSTAPVLQKTTTDRPIAQYARLNNDWNHDKISIACIKESLFVKIQWDWDLTKKYEYSLVNCESE